MSREQLTTILALLVSAVWALIALSTVLTRDYTALSIVSPVMLIVAGFLFGIRPKTNGTNGTKVE